MCIKVTQLKAMADQEFKQSPIYHVFSTPTGDSDKLSSVWAMIG